jgi:hypothetical protein
MEPRGSEVQQGCSSPPDDDLGRLIRWSVPDVIRGAEPPTDVWPKVVERVRAGAAREPRVPSLRRATFPLAPFVQAVVISALLLAFGLGVDRSIILPRQVTSPSSTPEVRKTHAVEDMTDDMLSGYILARSGHEAPARRGGNIQ